GVAIRRLVFTPDNKRLLAITGADARPRISSYSPPPTGRSGASGPDQLGRPYGAVPVKGSVSGLSGGKASFIARSPKSYRATVVGYRPGGGPTVSALQSS